MHFQKRYDHRFVGSWDIPGGGCVVTIERIEGPIVIDVKPTKDNPEGKDSVVLMHFKGTDKPMILNTTNATTIASIYGNDDDAWIGKKVRLVVKKVKAFGSWVEAVRIESNEPRV